MRRTLPAGTRMPISAGPRRMTRLMIIIAASLTAAAAGVCAAALATTPGSNGQIAFRRWLNDETSRSALYTMNPDGTGVRRIVPRLRRAHDDQPTGRQMEGCWRSRAFPTTGRPGSTLSTATAPGCGV